MSSLRMALLALVCTFSAHAQTATGTLSGLVRDQQGGVITNAQITVINSDKGVTRVAATNGEGLYSLTALDAGTYAGVGPRPFHG